MIGYALFGSNDLPRSFAFYDAVFASIGVGRLMEFPTGAVVWGAGWNSPMLGTGPAYDGKPATAGNGTMIAISVDSRAQVGAMHAAALAAGGADEGSPGVRGDEGPQAFYGAYFRDPDGNKLCVYRVGPA